jgi:hypothetical protein
MTVVAVGVIVVAGSIVIDGTLTVCVGRVV